MIDTIEKLFREIIVWKRIDDNTLQRYRCLQVLPDDGYFVKSSDVCSWPLDREQLSQQDFYFVDSLFQDALQSGSFTLHERLEDAIVAFDTEFSADEE